MQRQPVLASSVTKSTLDLDDHSGDMPKLPSSVSAYRRTRVFDERTLPEGLLRDHRTRSDTWGRLVVLEGQLKYRVPELGLSCLLRPGVEGVIAPGIPHSVEPQGRVLFFVEFLREP